MAKTRFDPPVRRLRELVPVDDPLHDHDLTFDVRFARGVAEYLASPNDAAVERLAQLPAVTHLLQHAERFDQRVPNSPNALIRHLLARSAQHRGAVPAPYAIRPLARGRVPAGPLVMVQRP